VFKTQPPFKTCFRNACPYDVPLPHVPDSLSAVNHVMNLPFKYRFKISLHFSACHFYPNAEWKSASGFHGVDVRADNFNFTVVNRVIFHACNKFKGKGFVAAKFNMGVLLADSLTFKRGTVSDGNRHINYFYFTTAHFKRFFNNFIVGDF